MANMILFHLIAHITLIDNHWEYLPPHFHLLRFPILECCPRSSTRQNPHEGLSASPSGSACYTVLLHQFEHQYVSPVQLFESEEQAADYTVRGRFDFSGFCSAGE